MRLGGNVFYVSLPFELFSTRVPLSAFLCPFPNPLEGFRCCSVDVISSRKEELLQCCRSLGTLRPFCPMAVKWMGCASVDSRGRVCGRTDDRPANAYDWPDIAEGKDITGIATRIDGRPFWSCSAGTPSRLCTLFRSST